MSGVFPCVTPSAEHGARVADGYDWQSLDLRRATGSLRTFWVLFCKMKILNDLMRRIRETINQSYDSARLGNLWYTPYDRSLSASLGDPIIDPDWNTTMQCQYCGKEFLMVSGISRETDFCSPRHRQRFHQGLAIAMLRIQDEASLRPTGQPGFQPQMAASDCTPQSTCFTPMTPVRLRPAGRLRFRLAVDTTEMLRESLLQNKGLDEAEMDHSHYEAALTIHQPVASRLHRISSILSEIRGDIEKRRRDMPDFSSQRRRALLIQLKPAV